MHTRTMSNILAEGRCVPCEGGVPPLAGQEIQKLMSQLRGWEVQENKCLKRSWTFDDFAQALAFVNRVATIAEQERHHPDIVLGWGYATLTLSTHAIGGLSRNDFIVAAKINELLT